MSYRGSSPVSSLQRAPEQTESWIPVTSTGMTAELECPWPYLRQRRDALPRDDLGQLDGRLVEGIDAHEPRGENRFQHEMHHQRPHRALVKAGEIEGAHRPARAQQRL